MFGWALSCDARVTEDASRSVARAEEEAQIRVRKIKEVKTILSYGSL